MENNEITELRIENITSIKVLKVGILDLINSAGVSHHTAIGLLEEIKLDILDDLICEEE